MSKPLVEILRNENKEPPQLTFHDLDCGEMFWPKENQSRDLMIKIGDGIYINAFHPSGVILGHVDHEYMPVVRAELGCKVIITQSGDKKNND